MGVCGCGKSTIGKSLASEYSIQLEDADDYHPKSNVDKMAKGIPLTDEDRAPWYALLRQRLIKANEDKAPVVLACSALKAIYREQMKFPDCRFAFVYLEGDYETLKSRLEERQDHFMPTSLLDSQLATLEFPTEAIVVNINLSVEDIVKAVKAEIVERY